MNTAAWLFCVGSLAACLGVAALLYPHAVLDSERVALLSTPQPMENFDLVVDLGEDYGVLTVIDLVAYYLENPPAKVQAGQAPVIKREFGGC